MLPNSKANFSDTWSLFKEGPMYIGTATVARPRFLRITAPGHGTAGRWSAAAARLHWERDGKLKPFLCFVSFSEKICVLLVKNCFLYVKQAMMMRDSRGCV